MLRSLVGSEMCIRDRKKGTRNEVDPGEEIQAVQGRPRALRPGAIREVAPHLRDGTVQLSGERRATTHSTRRWRQREAVPCREAELEGGEYNLIN